MSKAKSTKPVQAKTIVDDTSLESKVDELLDAVERMTSANDRIADSMERIADMTDKINEFLEDPERCRTAGIPICIQHINGYVIDNTFDKVISIKIEDPVKITNPDNEYLDVGNVYR